MGRLNKSEERALAYLGRGRMHEADAPEDTSGSAASRLPYGDEEWYYNVNDKLTYRVAFSTEKIKNVTFVRLTRLKDGVACTPVHQPMRDFKLCSDVGFWKPVPPPRD